MQCRFDSRLLGTRPWPPAGLLWKHFPYAIHLWSLRGMGLGGAVLGLFGVIYTGRLVTSYHPSLLPAKYVRTDVLRTRMALQPKCMCKNIRKKKRDRIPSLVNDDLLQKVICASRAARPFPDMHMGGRGRGGGGEV